MKLRRPQIHHEKTAGPVLAQTYGPLAMVYEWRAAIATGAFVVVFIFITFIGIPLWRLRDTVGVPELTGTATVLEKHMLSGKFGASYYVSFRVGDRITTMRVNDLEKWALANKDDVVRVDYRVGKSGTLYVDDWTPALQRQTGIGR